MHSFKVLAVSQTIQEHLYLPWTLSWCQVLWTSLGLTGTLFALRYCVTRVGLECPGCTMQLPIWSALTGIQMEHNRPIGETVFSLHCADYVTGQVAAVRDRPSSSRLLFAPEAHYTSSPTRPLRWQFLHRCILCHESPWNCRYTSYSRSRLHLFHHACIKLRGLWRSLCLVAPIVQMHFVSVHEEVSCVESVVAAPPLSHDRMRISDFIPFCDFDISSFSTVFDWNFHVSISRKLQK